MDKTLLSKPNVTLPLQGQIFLFLVVRTIMSVMIRMVHPFLPVFARGLNVDLETFALVLSASYAGGIIGPFVATVSDKTGRKAGMLLGLFIFTLGTFVIVIWPNLFIFFLAIMLATIGRNIVIPAMVAYIGDHVPFEKRGAAIGIIETSWSLAFILCIPLVGLLIEEVGWKAPFTILALCSVAMITAVQIALPRDEVRKPSYRQQPFAYLHLVLNNRSAVSGLIMGLFVFTGSASIQIIFGAWLEDSFKLSVTALGLAAMVIGFAQLGGELLSTTLTDRLGKKRSVYIGLCLSILVCAMIFRLDDTLQGALIWLFIFFIGLEYAVISSISMMSEIVPDARASMIATYFATVSIGFSIGPIISTKLYNIGFPAIALACVILFSAGIFFLSRIRIPVKSD